MIMMLNYMDLVFVPGVGILEIMKQQQIYFMSDFIPLEFHTDSSFIQIIFQ